jgi:hypothetical protein
MSNPCRIFNTIERIRAAAYCNVAFLGGSLTAAAGSGDAAITCWRRRFVRYLYERYHRPYHCQPSEVMGAIGANESFAAVFTLSRNVLPYLPVLAFVEFCVNDSGCPDKTLVKKGIEGIIRQLRSCPTHPDVVLLGAGHRPGAVPSGRNELDQSLHREIADYYGLSFIDVHSYILATLKKRKQTWDDVSITFESNDGCHLNDYGSHLWFEALREWFEEQWVLYDLNPSSKPSSDLPKAYWSDEFQHTSLIDPSKRNKAIVMNGTWQKKMDGCIPWYFDNLLVGVPGDKMSFAFTGTAIGVSCLLYCNGLKVEARLDGEEVAGPYTNFAIEFGKFFVLKHGLELKEHVLELTVAQPTKRRNRHEHPTAQIGYLLVAHGPQKPDKN